MKKKPLRAMKPLRSNRMRRTKKVQMKTQVVKMEMKMALKMPKKMRLHLLNLKSVLMTPIVPLSYQILIRTPAIQKKLLLKFQMKTMIQKNQTLITSQNS